MAQEKLKAPAKVNLRLKITGRRPDGYHLLDMVMVKLDLADQIELTLDGDGLEIRVDCDNPHLPVDSSNTLWRVADLVRQESGKKFGLKAFLKKQIPVAAGLGGGSSDAAAVLGGLNSLLKLGWSQSKLIGLGTHIGADVPFFLVSGSQRVGGIGAELSPIQIAPLHLILVNPGFPVSTADAYRWYDEAKKPPLSRLTTERVDASFPPLENDLEEVVIPRYPVLSRIKSLLNQAGALGTLMSGSGPTVFGHFATRDSRDRGYEILLKARDPNWWIHKGANLA